MRLCRKYRMVHWREEPGVIEEEGQEIGIEPLEPTHSLGIRLRIRCSHVLRLAYSLQSLVSIDIPRTGLMLPCVVRRKLRPTFVPSISIQPSSGSVVALSTNNLFLHLLFTSTKSLSLSTHCQRSLSFALAFEASFCFLHPSIPPATMADDDAAKARMMADLGLSRRDQVSAPVEPGNRGPRVDPREQQRAVDAHRARTEAAAAAGGGNGNQANSIAAWNSKYFACLDSHALTSAQILRTSSRTKSPISWRTGSAAKVIALP